MEKASPGEAVFAHGTAGIVPTGLNGEALVSPRYG